MVIDGWHKQLHDDPEYVCCSCQQLHQGKSVTKVSLDNKLGQVVWPKLKAFILQHKESAHDSQLYMCTYCKPKIKHELMPGRCVLNGLETTPIPSKLASLGTMGRQFLQCFQTAFKLWSG